MPLLLEVHMYGHEASTSLRVRCTLKSHVVSLVSLQLRLC